MQSEFPTIEFVDLAGYRLKYGVSRWHTILKIILQIPKILTGINREKKWLRNFIRYKHVDVIVSDNRFGLRHKNILSIFITHQLHIKTSLGKFFDLMVQKANYYFINQFNYCWVPDVTGDINFAGELSHPKLKPNISLFYIGALSRINKEEIPVTNKLLIILSGPEPQRTIIENTILAQLKNTTYAAIVIRGLPAATIIEPPRKGISVYNHIPALSLQHLINQSEIIISRPGYSSVMDLLPLSKKCIFIPTPGQAEQEYLADWLTQNNYACTCQQDKFALAEMIEKAEKINTTNLSFLKTPEQIETAIKAVTEKLTTRL